MPELTTMHGTDSPIQRVLKQRRGQVLSMIVVMPHSCAIAATGSGSWTSNRIDVGDSRTITGVVDHRHRDAICSVAQNGATISSAASAALVIVILIASTNVRCSGFVCSFIRSHGSEERSNS